MKLKHVPFLLLALASANANTLDVTSLSDSGAGSLRSQIAAATSGDIVNVNVTGTIALTTGEIIVTAKDLTINGPGAHQLSITTNATTRALRIVNGQCTITGLTFHNCKGLSGDVDTGGAVTVDNFTAGGSDKTTTLRLCTFTNNQSGWGGAVDFFSGGFTLEGCTFSGNTCTGLAFATNGGGGAISLGPTLPSTITNCTFSNNIQNGAATAQPGGGALYNYGAGTATPPPVAIEHCTFIGNVDAAGAAGAIKGNYTGSYHSWAELRNCLLLNNQAPASTLLNFGVNATGPLTSTYASLGGNVTDEIATSAEVLVGDTDVIGSTTLASTVAPAPALNGGTTPSFAILRGSPAQRSGLASAVATDQRGALRHPAADAGAFELIEPEIALRIEASPLPEHGTLAFGSTPFDTPITGTLTVTNTQTSPFTTGPLTLGNVSTPAGYSVGGFPATALANGESATFEVTLIASETGLFEAPLTFHGNDSYDPSLDTTDAGLPNLHTLHLTGLVTDTIDHWRQQEFGATATNSGEAADLANPMSDGLSNLLKYTLGLDPFTNYSSQSGIEASLDPEGYLSMTVTRNPAATDITLSIEVSDDLGATSPWNTEETTIMVDTPTTLEARDNVPMSSAQRRFIRLNAKRR